jgi:hypothetical protein
LNYHSTIGPRYISCISWNSLIDWCSTSTLSVFQLNSQEITLFALYSGCNWYTEKKTPHKWGSIILESSHVASKIGGILHPVSLRGGLDQNISWIHPRHQTWNSPICSSLQLASTCVRVFVLVISMICYNLLKLHVVLCIQNNCITKNDHATYI